MCFDKEVETSATYGKEPVLTCLTPPPETRFLCVKAMKIATREDMLARSSLLKEADGAQDVFARTLNQPALKKAEKTEEEGAVAVHTGNSGSAKAFVLRRLSSELSGLLMTEESPEAAIEMAAKFMALAARANSSMRDEAQREAVERQYEHLKSELREHQRKQPIDRGVQAPFAELKSPEEVADQPLTAPLQNAHAEHSSKEPRKSGLLIEKTALPGDVPEEDAEAASQEIRADASRSLQAQANVPAEAAEALL